MSATLAKTTGATGVEPKGGVLGRTLWLYGLYTLVSNACFLVGYYLLPEGFLRGSPQVAVGAGVAQVQAFWPQLGLTLLLNLGLMAGLCVVLNLNRVRGFPMGYLLPIMLGIVGGLISGTNSFAASDLSNYSARDGMALGLSIGGLEMLGYVLIVASTVRYGVYRYRSWWRWGGEWSATKVMRLRDVRLSRQEALALLAGVLLIIAAAFRETAMLASPW